MPYNAIDLFCGCGGVTQGLKDAGFNVLVGMEKSSAPAFVYRANHPEVRLFESDITELSLDEISATCDGQVIHLIAGCPPCQGFFSIRCHNSRQPRPPQSAPRLRGYY
jgi:DNA (cytosine-5)-methyltransferase 1